MIGRKEKDTITIKDVPAEAFIKAVAEKVPRIPAPRANHILTKAEYII